MALAVKVPSEPVVATVVKGNMMVPTVVAKGNVAVPMKL